MASSKPLRIVSIAHSAVSRDAGRLRYYPLAARRDIDLHLVVPAVWKEFGRTLIADPPAGDRLNVHVLPIRLASAGLMRWYLHFYPKLNRLLNEIKPDVLHLWEEPWSVVALQAVLLGKNAALVLEVDQNILKRLPPPFEAIRKYVLRHTDHILSRSDEATAVVRARGYRGTVTMVGYGVDQETFFPSTIPRSGASTAFRIGYVGRLVEEKGLDDALDAIVGKPDISLTLMGQGPYESSLRQRVRKLGLSDQVSFRGWGTAAEVAQFLRNLDALVLLTRTTNAVREQFGRVILEAQACGVPVIGSQSGAIPGVVGDGGWIIPESDPQSLRRLLESLMADSAEVAAKALAARKNIEARFTYNVVADALAVASKLAAAKRTNDR